MLAALCRYYDCLQRQPDSGLLPDGYSKISVNWNLVLTADGGLKDILPYTRTVTVGEKERQIGREELFPFRNSVPGIAAETIEHRGKYLFGMEWADGTFVCSKNSLLAFEKCREKNLAFLEPLTSPVVDAFKKFLEGWIPEAETGNAKLGELAKEFNLAKFIVTTEDNILSPLHRDAGVMAAWESRRVETLPEGEVTSPCSITGKAGPIARIHDSLSGIQGGLSMGVGLVNMKTSAFWSYGKRESYNSGVSEESMKKYTRAFNYLTSAPNHKQLLEDMTLLFWVETEAAEKPYLETFQYGLFGLPSAENLPEDECRIRAAREEALAALFGELARGREANWQSFDMDGSSRFYLLGIKPNASRLAVKLFERNRFGKLMENLARHHRDFGLSPEDKQLSLWQVDKALQSPVTNTPLPSDLLTGLLKSIFRGSPYPYTLLTLAVRRVKTDRDDKQKGFYSANRTRIRIIKACLSRLHVIKGEDDMLNTNSENAAYNCGRLFALLENIQRCALGEVNATIKDKFFSSACSTPSLVFPRLVKLAQPHLSHLKKTAGGLANFFEREIGEIAQKLLDGFPRTLGLEQQGMFEIGYYAQRYTKYEAEIKEETQKGEER